MAKESCITFDINLARAQELCLTQKRIDKLRIDFRALTLNSIKNKDVFDLLLLRGQKGEIAYVRNDSYYRHPQITLITEFPLSLKSEEQRKWIAMVSKLFKPQFISDIEIAHHKKGFTRVDNSYKVFESDVYDLNKPKQKIHIKMRYKKYSDNVPYGSKSKDYNRDYFNICKWIIKRYKKIEKSLSYEERFLRIQKELESLKFGNRSHPHISTAGIKTIYYKYRHKF